ncbi:MAG: hypothetical protein ACKVOE_05110 [Rickettsiales bacterium]
MTHFILFTLYIAFGVFMLVSWPILIHPTMAPRRKLLFIALSFIVLVPAGMALYLAVGAPPLAAL